MHSITLALLLQLPPAVIAVAVASQHPTESVSPYGLMTEREWVSAMASFVLGKYPDNPGDQHAVEQYLKRERQKDEKIRLVAQNKNVAKAALLQLIAEHDAQLVPSVRAYLPPAEVLGLVHRRVMLGQILAGIEAMK